MARHLHTRFAIRGVGIGVATAVLRAHPVGGHLLLETLCQRFGAFRVAGGIILLPVALTMIFGESTAEREIEKTERDRLAGAVFPLAMPSIAAPGAMLAIAVLTDTHTEPPTDRILTVGLPVGLPVGVRRITPAVPRPAGRVLRLIGTTGAGSIGRVMGVILATIAVDAALGRFDPLGAVDLDADRGVGTG